MSTKHTPGPWVVETHATNYFGVRAAGPVAERWQVARTVISPQSVRRAEGLANARLIAAAPELLAELKWCFMGAGDITRMAAVIAKAEALPIPAEGDA